MGLVRGGLRAWCRGISLAFTRGWDGTYVRGRMRRRGSRMRSRCIGSLRRSRRRLGVGFVLCCVVLARDGLSRRKCLEHMNRVFTDGCQQRVRRTAKVAARTGCERSMRAQRAGPRQANLSQTASRARATESALTPSISTILWRLDRPETTRTLRLGTLSRWAMKATSSAFAAPSTGGAARRIFGWPSWSPADSVRAARGWTYTVIRADGRVICAREAGEIESLIAVIIRSDSG